MISLDRRTKDLLQNHILQNEGFVEFPYDDKNPNTTFTHDNCVGKLTIGIGTLLPLTRDEAFLLVWHRMNIIFDEIESYDGMYHFFFDLLEHRLAFLALADMSYNLGAPRFMGFKKMIKHVLNRDFTLASDEAMNSKWATQVPNRASLVRELLKRSDDE